MTRQARRQAKYDRPRPAISATVERAVRHRAGDRCQVPGCTAQEKVGDLHHIDGDRGRNTPSNLILLCPNHHRLQQLRKIAGWRLHWYNWRSGVLTFLRDVLPFTFRRASKRRGPGEQIFEMASGRNRWLAAGILLIVMTCCVVAVLVIVLGR